MTAAAPVIRRFAERHPADVAQVLDRHTPDEASAVLATLPPRSAAALLSRMNPDLAGAAVAIMPNDAAAALLRAADPADAALLLGHMRDDKRDELAAALPPDLRQEVAAISTFPPGTAGEIMQAHVTRFADGTTVETALGWVRAQGGRAVSEVVVTDGEGHFAGVVPLQSLLVAGPRVRLGELVAPSPISVPPMARRDDVVELISRHHLSSVPVVDSERRVLGVIRHAGLLEAAQEEAAADAQRMFGASGEEGALSSPGFSVRSRLPWLNVNLVTAFIAASVVGLFESTLAKFTALAVLMPIVAGQSGNTGAQALAVTMRSLALREVRPAHAFRVLRKEAVVGFCNGLAIASLTAAGTLIWSRTPGLALVIFSAMLLSMMVASLAGATIPMMLARLGRDPAVASSIILTAITDVVGFFTFLGLATVLAGMLTGL